MLSTEIMRKILALLVCLVVCGGLCEIATADVSLSFHSAIELPRALADSDFVPNATFASAVSDLLNSALSPSETMIAQAYAVDDDIVIVGGTWATGSESSVSSTVASLETTFASASTTPAFLAGINQLSVEYAGRQPTSVVVSDACTYTAVVNPLSPTTCLRNLTISFLVTPTASVQTGALHATLCRMLDTDCGLVSFIATTDTTITNPGTATVTSFRQSTFTIQAEDRDTALVTIVRYANSASLLSSYNISYIYVNAVMVYYQGDEPVLTEVGEIGTCVSSYWYLIFLIILVPIILIISQRMYFWGRTSGKQSISKAERDIRAGVHLSQAWSSPGVAGMGGFGMIGGGMQQNSGWYSPQGQSAYPQQAMQGYGDNQQMMMMPQAQLRGQPYRQQMLPQQQSMLAYPQMQPQQQQQQQQWMMQQQPQLPQQQQLQQQQWMMQQQPQRMQQQGWGYA